jgi:hypothetical protein
MAARFFEAPQLRQRGLFPAAMLIGWLLHRYLEENRKVLVFDVHVYEYVIYYVL